MLNISGEIKNLNYSIDFKNTLRFSWEEKKLKKIIVHTKTNKHDYYIILYVYNTLSQISRSPLNMQDHHKTRKARVRLG